MATKARKHEKKGTVGLPVFVFLVCVVSFVSSREAVVGAQALAQRGFVEGSTRVLPQRAPNDPARVVGDVLAREEVFFKPTPWIQFAGGIDLRANSHEQVDDRWRIDLGDRGSLRPRVSLRRLAATLTRGPFSLDVGKQFIRWGKADIINPTDRFAPQDFVNVLDAEFIAVTGARGAVQSGSETFEAVWVPRFTPSRVPLFDQRWTVVPSAVSAIPLVDAGSTLPGGAQAGLRWNHVGAGVEYSLSFFNGVNHLPNIDSRVSLAPLHVELTRTYPAIRTYGADAAMPTRWFTVKGEAAYVTSPSALTDEYVLYIVQLERQTGEWMIVGGYAGEAVTARRSDLAFAPDRGMTKSIVARASYTLDGNRSLAMETAVRQNGAGVYAKAQYSQARGQHWRATLTGVAIAGHLDDFLGQYHRNSHVALTLRYSF
jgi:hypothetical protein